MQHRGLDDWLELHRRPTRWVRAVDTGTIQARPAVAGVSGQRRYLICSPGFSAIPGSSASIWKIDDGPRSGSVHSRNAHATFFSGVTSITCTIPGQSGFFTPAVQLQMMVLPLARRWA